MAIGLGTPATYGTNHVSEDIIADEDGLYRICTPTQDLKPHEI